MLHELLLALYGIPGAIFVESPKTNEREIADILDLDSYMVPITKTLPFISQAELSLNEELLKLGSYYKYLEQFIRSHGGPYQGLYLASIAFGIDNALKGYRQILQSLESEAMSDPNIGVSYFSYKLHPYKSVLPILTKIAINVNKSIYHIDNGAKNSSCCLLDILLQAVPTGLPSLRFVTQKILAHSLQIFYRQLSSWLIHGVLHDPHEEFFIQIQKDIPSSNSTDRSINQFNTAHISFIINANNIPSFLPSAVAQRILFTGETVHRATSDPSKSSFLVELEKTYSPKFAELSQFLDKFIERQNYGELEFDAVLDVNALQNLISQIQNFVSHSSWSSLMQEHDLLQYLRSVKDVFLLGRGELFLAFIDQLGKLNSLDNSRTTTAVDTNTLNQCSFLDRSPPLDPNETRALEYDIAEAFLLAARFIGLDDEELDSQFRFIVSQTPVDPDYLNSAEPSLWDCIELQLIVPASLRCLFSHQVCRAYNRLFHYLFTIRCTQLELQHYWANQTVLWRHRFAANLFHSSNPSSSINSVENQTLNKAALARMQSCIDRRLLVRNYMAFIVENLQYYLQVDVIESQFCHLLDRIESDQEVELVQVAHEACLAALQAQALLFLPETRQCILRLLTVCRRFVRVTSPRPKHGDEDEFRVTDLEEQLIREFQLLSKTLFECLNSSSTSGAKSSVCLESGPKRFERTRSMGTADLSQLLLRLDFNHFYSESDGLLRMA